MIFTHGALLHASMLGTHWNEVAFLNISQRLDIRQPHSIYQLDDFGAYYSSSRNVILFQQAHLYTHSVPLASRKLHKFTQTFRS